MTTPNLTKCQSSIEDKTKLLSELGLQEDSLVYVDRSPPTGAATLSKEYGCRSFDRCSVNECPFNLLTFGATPDGRIVLFRGGQPGDPQLTCHIRRQDRESYYAELDPQIQALLPNKGLQYKEIQEEARITAMPEPERAEYLRKKEENHQKWLAGLKLLKNNPARVAKTTLYACGTAQDGIKLPPQPPSAPDDAKT